MYQCYVLDNNNPPHFQGLAGRGTLNVIKYCTHRGVSRAVTLIISNISSV